MQNTFDYIVVGAGSAGCVLANRLSAGGKYSVCLVEAGPRDRSPFIHIPFGIIGLIREGRHNWGYYTEPEPHLKNRRLYWPRGKTWGGSSSINAMVYIRGNPADYDDWAANGCEGWSWNDLLPVFRSLENNETWRDSLLHGNAGELNVAEVREINPLSKTFIEAGREVGYHVNEDFNGVRQDGVGYYQVTQKNGLRFSSAKAFLYPALSRSNLTVESDAVVTRVVVEDGVARGVEIRQDDQTRTIGCRKEVILCGGAINSPQILLLSGIGPATELDALGIPVVQDSPGVGKNLQDHLDITVMINESSKKSIGLSLAALPKSVIDVFKFIFKRKGMLASNAAEAGAFLHLPDDAQGRPGIQLHFIPSFLRDHGRDLSPGHGCTIHACQLRPRSRGEITLRDKDPLSHPCIHANYLSDLKDAEDMIKATRIARELFSTKAFSPVNAGEDLPGAGVQSDAEILEDIRKRAETIYHPAGTCRMGADEESVVDPKLRVRGVKGLRVADASIMPTLIGGNTNAPCMVIGEKCARLVLAEAGMA